MSFVREASDDLSRRELRSLRGGLAPSSGRIERMKDGIIASSHPLSSYPVRQVGGKRRGGPRSYTQLDGLDEQDDLQTEASAIWDVDDKDSHTLNTEESAHGSVRSQREKGASLSVQTEKSAIISDSKEESPLFNTKESVNVDLMSQLEKGSLSPSHFSHRESRRRHNASEHRQRRGDEFGEEVGLAWQQSLKPPSTSSVGRSCDRSVDGRRRGGGRRCNHGSSRSGSVNSQRHSWVDERGTIPSPLPPQSLYHRWDLWLTFAITQLISIGSLRASTNQAYYSSIPHRGAAEATVLFFASVSFTVSFLISIGCFHEPFREFITTAPVAQRVSVLAKVREIATVEQYIALFILKLVSIQAGLVLRAGGPFAVAGAQIRSANLFYSTWLGLYGAAYLAATVTTVTTMDGNMGAWLMVLFSSTCTAVTLWVLHSGPICADTLGGTYYCTTSAAGGGMGCVSAVLSFSYVASLRECRRRGHPPSRAAGLACASILVGIHTALVTLVTTPGGPGSSVGSAFVVSWSTWIFGVLLWKASVASFFAPPQASPPAAGEKQHQGRGGDGTTLSRETVAGDRSDSVFPSLGLDSPGRRNQENRGR